MEFEERPLLHFADLVAALLHAGGPQPARVEDAAALLARDLIEAHEQPVTRPGELRYHLDRALRHLAAAHLVEMLDAERFRITPRGRGVLHDHPDGIDDTVLMGFPEFADWVVHIAAHAPPTDTRRREFEAGWMARQGGGDLTDNPYAADTAQHAAWEDGWLEARGGGNSGRMPG